jgi:hypothetical protein
VARHRAAGRRGWSPARSAPAGPPAAANAAPVNAVAASPEAATRVAASGMLAVAALGGALAAADRLDAVAHAEGGALAELATVASWMPSAGLDDGRGIGRGIEPVPPEPPAFELDSLLKGVAAAARETAARAELATRTCAAATSGFGSVKNWVATAGEELRCRFGVATVYGVAGRAGSSDHPLGLALDFMVDRATGDRLADFALRNRRRLGINYVIYRQRINFGTGWQAMEDRGSPTANHMDHVHISFQPRPARNLT